VCKREGKSERRRERERSREIVCMVINFSSPQIMLVVELMHKGNLKDYLPTLRPRYEANKLVPT
jgi:hypothetical protein